MAKSSAAPAQLLKLKELAEAATQGDWEFDGEQFIFTFDSQPVAEVRGFGAGLPQEANGYFIAALNPKAILEILAAHQALYEALSALVSQIETSDTRTARISRSQLDKAKSALALADAAQEGEANGE